MGESDNMSMNEELKEWLKETKKEKSDETEDYSKKKPTGYCNICGERRATAVCIKCGRSVCPSCYFKIINVCKKCVPDDIASKWDGSRPDWEEKLGVEWIE
ncbi:MAG: hypothetical protein V5A64_06360 [Candidatus Thermoplasmatota archaeon]